MISVIIRTYNEEKYLKETLKSIFNSNCDVEVIIVDNYSIDNTIEIAKQYPVKIVYISKEQFSWGRAINRGIAEAIGEYILLVSGHCVLTENSLLNGIDFLTDNKIDVVYARQIGDAHKDLIEYIELKNDYPDLSYVVRKNQKYFVCSNAGALFKNDIWKKHKFDEELLSAEDGEWAHRILLEGYKIGYCSEFVIIHGHDFNRSYVYKKWFYRTLVNDRNRSRIDLLVRGSFMFYILKSTGLIMQYRKILKSENLLYNKAFLSKYIYLREKARKKARNSLLFQYDEEKNKTIVSKIK